MFEPLLTERLLLRAVQPDDVEALFQRRNDPEVAALQAWELPYAYERAERIITDAAAMPGPADGRWWMVTVTLRATGEVLGDLVMHATNELRTVEVGYALARRAWGHGYAVEALEALVAWLMESLPVTRLEGRLHPDNRASAQVLERTGFRFEGHTRLSFWLGQDNSDDWIYGMTRDDWAAWRDRPRSTPQDLRLVPITPENRHDVARLATHHSQQALVAPVLVSMADALVPDVVDGAPVEPWLRALEGDGVLVGFVMLASPTQAHPEPFLWRLLVDRLHQRRGIGSAALGLIEEQCRAWGAAGLLVSWEEGRGSPRPFYLAHGFVPTGRVVAGETEARLALR
ncbi:MAG: GNAT family N-acetyltransferase [Candidatus Nanopelagicales bacterium]|nr:GNAT family N-acetyltransferase [Candidatus Nanopelagicales bacterium]